jgi:hypothetical protein
MTRSPTAKTETAGPTAMTSPAISKPKRVEPPKYGRPCPASALGQVGTVQARGANADQKIGQPQFGFGYLGDLQDVGVAKSSNRRPRK